MGFSITYLVTYIGYGSMNTQYECTTEITTTTDWSTVRGRDEIMFLVHHNLRKEFPKYKILSIEILE